MFSCWNNECFSFVGINDVPVIEFHKNLICFSYENGKYGIWVKKNVIISAYFCVVIVADINGVLYHSALGLCKDKYQYYIHQVNLGFVDALVRIMK